MDTYLTVQPGESVISRKLEEAWNAAARIATQHITNRAHEVCTQCARNMLAAGQPKAAAAMHLQAGDKRCAIRVLCGAGLTADARTVAASETLLLEFVEELDATGIQREAPAAGTDPLGKTMSVADLDEQARRGNWTQVIPTFLCQARLR
jgi:hypothetical protein